MRKDFGTGARRLGWACLLCWFTNPGWGFAQPKSEPGPAPLSPDQAIRQARLLVADLLGRKPERASTNTGLLRIRTADGRRIELPVQIEIVPTPTNWSSTYTIPSSDGIGIREALTVIQSDAQPNEYLLSPGKQKSTTNSHPAKLSADETMRPFGGSDFWVADLGLEFLHWPQQRVLKKELRRGQACDVLESVNPQPSAPGYVRVVSWIDKDTDGIVHADAYNRRNELIKQFDPTQLKKVNGERQLEEMEMRNRQTGSHSWIKFNLSSEGR